LSRYWRAIFESALRGDGATATTSNVSGPAPPQRSSDRRRS
jgi:hypothetical protein